MRLAPFIKANIEEISTNWELFAVTLLPEKGFTQSVLRNDIVGILNEIARDMDRTQSGGQQREKSEGSAGQNQDIDDAAAKHALQRISMGVSSLQLISEFRALRASIIRMWQAGNVAIDELSLVDLIRFNETVDQLLSKGAKRHTEETDRSRNMFLAILGHDLRNPIGAISGCAELQLRATTLDLHGALASRILGSAARMSQMITDLIELTRVRLGSGIVITPSHTSMRRICVNALEEMEAIYPDRSFQLYCDGELPGEWDEARMTQVLSNLVGNAVQHGATKLPITITAKRNRDGTELAVHNEGTTIRPDIISNLFDGFFQGKGKSGEEAGDERSSSLGLGLYIAKGIVMAHGGTLEVQLFDDDEGTTFIARLPVIGPSGSVTLEAKG